MHSNKIWNIIFLVAVVVIGFVYRDTIKNIWAQSINHYFPCRVPITYTIGTFDTQFGVSKADFLDAMAQAEAIWEKPLGRNLFQYEAGGSMKVNLIYDNRQATTQQLQGMGIVVQNNRASYDSLKAKYDSLNADYQSQKSAFDTRLAAFETRKQTYENDVTTANSHGGANKQTYARLNTEKDYLNGEASALSQLQDQLNNTISNINALTSALNDLAKTLNIDVQNYNTVGSNLGGEFDEGLYKSSSAGREIDIYQFEDKTKLIRVLAHELGHALGLEHVNDPKAIMYYQNVGENEKLTSTDLTALKNLCGIK